MGIFNYIDTFFFISLGITFVLILLLVFHFKQRMSVLEEKTDTMFEIINNIVKEVVSIKNILYHSVQPINNAAYLDPSTRTIPLINETMRFDDDNNKIDDEEEENSESDESESDESEDDESESDEEEDDESEEEEDSESDDEEKTVENIVLEETEVLANESSEQIKVVNVDLNEVEVTHVSEPVEELLVEKVEVPTVINDAETAEEKRENALEVYRKMSLPALKTLLITKGLSSDPSKMKKYDILNLLEKNLDQ
jgi:hypothetical protein